MHFHFSNKVMLQRKIVIIVVMNFGLHFHVSLLLDRWWTSHYHCLCFFSTSKISSKTAVSMYNISDHFQSKEVQKAVNVWAAYISIWRNTSYFLSWFLSFILSFSIPKITPSHVTRNVNTMSLRAICSVKRSSLYDSENIFVCRTLLMWINKVNW